MATSPLLPAASATPAPLYHLMDTHDPAPNYRAEENIWERWEVVERAHSRVTECQVEIAELEPKLAEKTKEHERLKETSSNLFASLHSKPRSVLPTALKRLSSRSKAQETDKRDRNLDRKAFEVAHSEETTCMTQLEQIRDRIEVLKARIQKDASLASTVDQVWELLSASVAGSARNNDGNGMDEEEALACTSASAYDLAQKAVSDLTRARVTVQHAHLYYNTCLRTIDSVRGTPLGRAAVGGFGEMSKNQDYKVAVDKASKAQICFNETIRVLNPHVAEIPSHILNDFNALKELGLLQATKIYGLMYGWQRATSGVGKSVALMLQKQEKAFVHLTHLAVWIQDIVPIYEARLRASLLCRNQARRSLAAVWKARAGQEP